MATVETTFLELFKENRLTYGSWIKLPIGYRKFVLDKEQSGYKNDQIISNYEHQAVLAQCCEINDKNDTIVLLGMPTDYCFNLSGIASYFNAYNIVSNLCETMFSIPDYGITARSMTEKDYDFWSETGTKIVSPDDKSHNIFLEVSPFPFLKEHDIRSFNFMIGLKYLYLSKDCAKKTFEKTYYCHKDYTCSCSVCPVIEIPRVSDNILVLEDERHSGIHHKVPFQIMFQKN